ncbi:hypothetical protein F4824DRAFT_500474 [Ustulina deusta]|nr:hypothetical protein F4824DRAFT_500474 [Ustulina deusta]
MKSIPVSTLPLTIGNDICRTPRIRRILKGRTGPQFVRRILRPEEIHLPTTANILRCILDREVPSSRDARSIPGKADGTGEATGSPLTRDTPKFTRAVEFMAGRFAAKEAVIKAHPHRRLTFQSIAIVRLALQRNSPEDHHSASRTSEPAEKLAVVGQEEEARESRPEDEMSTPPPQRGPLVAEIQGDDVHRTTCASVSISHDTDYATAVCLGVNNLPLVREILET